MVSAISVFRGIMKKKALDKKELIQKFRTEGILDAARRVIGRRGLDKTTMEQVAEEAGISKATIYLYFKNKETLYSNCVLDQFEEILDAMKAAIDGIDDPLMKLEKLVAAHLSAIEADREFFRVFFTEKPGIFWDQTSEFGREFAKRREEYSSFVAGVLKEGMDKGLLREVDPVKGFSLLFAMVRGMAMYKIIHNDKTPLSSEAGLILGVFFDGLRADK